MSMMMIVGERRSGAQFSDGRRGKLMCVFFIVVCFAAGLRDKSVAVRS